MRTVPPRVLITDAEERSVLAACRGLALAGYSVGAVSSRHPAVTHWSRSCERRLCLPNPRSHSAEFIAGLEAYLGGGEYAALLPGSEPAMLAISEHRDELEFLTRLGLPDHDVVRRSVDKLELIEHAAASGLEMPRSIICEDGRDAVEAARELGYPLVIKPWHTVMRGKGQMVERKCLVVDGPSALSKLVGGFGTPFLLQLYTTGPVVSCSGVIAERRLLASATARYRRMWMPDGGSASFSETIAPVPGLTERVEDLLNRIGWQGIFEVELLELGAGAFAAIDLNPRVFGSLSLVIDAGANLPAIWCDWLLGLDPVSAVADPYHRYRWEDAEFRHLMWQARRGRIGAAASVLVPHRRVTHAHFQLADPAPLAARVLDLGHAATNRLERAGERKLAGRPLDSRAAGTMGSVDRPGHASQSPLILAYHAVSTNWRSQMAIPERLLETHISLLKRRGYVGMTLAECERRRQEGSLPSRCVVVTFDDGYASTLRAKPVLDEAGFPATVFVVTDFVESGRPLSWHGTENVARDEREPLGWADLEPLVAAGWEVGSHTASHPLLSKLDDATLARELQESRKKISSRLGRCDTIAYPYGVADIRVATAAEVAGYQGGCMLTGAHIVDNAYRRPRIALGPADDGIRLLAQLSGIALRFRRGRTARMIRRSRRTRSWMPPQ